MQDFSTSPAHHWNRAKVKVSKLYNKITNIRKDFVHKSSNDLSKNDAVVLVEDLSIRNMSKLGAN
jgi:putative transposase